MREREQVKFWKYTQLNCLQNFNPIVIYHQMAGKECSLKYSCQGIQSTSGKHATWTSHFPSFFMCF
jgi:hypothetical protein